MVENSPWQLRVEHMNGGVFSKSLNKLQQFGTSDDPKLNTFAGTVFYATTFTAKCNEGLLQLGKVNKGVTEVFLNGKKLGVNWYGKPMFSLGDALVKGENKLEIRYTTVLSNYSKSLKDNPTAVLWTQGIENIPMGLEG